MKIPEKLKIGALTYRVIFDAQHCTSEAAFGESTAYKQIIFLDPCMQEDRKGQTLFHEVIHAIDATFNVGECRLTEQQVKSLGAHLYMILKNNGLLAK